MVRDEIYMLWLSSCYTLGSRKQNELLARFGTAREIFNAPVALLRMVNGINDNNINAITENRSLEYIENLLKKMEAGQMSYVSRSNDSFPYLLREIPDAPVGLFCVGTLPQDGAPSAAIIGSRRCSEYGLTAARMLSKPLSRRGIVIVSGMARGADSMAHHGAIEGGGKTIAVMGCGADVCYPPENKSLRNKIIEQGCVISEYPPGTQPFPAHFPPAEGDIDFKRSALRGLRRHTQRILKQYGPIAEGVAAVVNFPVLIPPGDGEIFDAALVRKVTQAAIPYHVDNDVVRLRSGRVGRKRTDPCMILRVGGNEFLPGNTLGRLHVVREQGYRISGLDELYLHIVICALNDRAVLPDRRRTEAKLLIPVHPPPGPEGVEPVHLVVDVHAPRVGDGIRNNLDSSEAFQLRLKQPSLVGACVEGIGRAGRFRSHGAYLPHGHRLVE